MKVIMLRDVPKVGKRFSVVDVNAGYAQNFLFPQKFAEPATKVAQAQLAKKLEVVRVEKNIQKSLLENSLKELATKVVTLRVKTNDVGHLFQGIHAKDIAEALQKEHLIIVAEEAIKLEKPIKEIGEYSITVAVGEMRGKFTVRLEKQ